MQTEVIGFRVERESTAPLPAMVDGKRVGGMVFKDKDAAFRAAEAVLRADGLGIPNVSWASLDLALDGRMPDDYGNKSERFQATVAGVITCAINHPHTVTLASSWEYQVWAKHLPSGDEQMLQDWRKLRDREGKQVVTKHFLNVVRVSMQFGDDEWRDEVSEYALVDFVMYHHDEEDRSVFISKDEYDRLQPHEYQLSNGSWPNEVSGLVSEIQEREDAISCTGDMKSIEVAVC